MQRLVIPILFEYRKNSHSDPTPSTMYISQDFQTHRFNVTVLFVDMASQDSRFEPGSPNLEPHAMLLSTACPIDNTAMRLKFSECLKLIYSQVCL